MRAQINDAVIEQEAKQEPELRDLTTKMTIRAVTSLQPQIEAFAKQQAQKLVSDLNKPRVLDRKSTEALIGCMRKATSLPIALAVGGDPEAQNYEKQIANALSAGGWVLAEQALLSAHLNFPMYGLAVVTRPSLKDSQGVKDLQECLRETNLSAPLVVTSEDEELGEYTYLVVLPKPR